MPRQSGQQPVLLLRSKMSGMCLSRLLLSVCQSDCLYRSIVNEAAAASPVQPIVNMGQGFFGYNPPAFVVDAAKGALDRVECNQYSPTKVRMSCA